MKRRTFVSAVGSAVIAGCSQSADDPSGRTQATKQERTTTSKVATATTTTTSDSSETTIGTPETTTTPERLGYVFPQEGTLLEDPGLLLTVSPVRTVATTAAPASLFVSITNLAEEKRWFYTGNRRAFGDVRSEETDPGYVLLSRDEVPERVGDRCWRPTGLPVGGAGSDDGNHVLLDHMHSFGKFLEVWEHPDNVGDCHPTGTFHFEDDVMIHEEDVREGDEIAEFDVGFEIRVAPPDT